MPRLESAGPLQGMEKAELWIDEERGTSVVDDSLLRSLPLECLLGKLRSGAQSSFHTASDISGTSLLLSLSYPPIETRAGGGRLAIGFDSVV